MTHVQLFRRAGITQIFLHELPSLIAFVVTHSCFILPPISHTINFIITQTNWKQQKCTIIEECLNNSDTDLEQEKPFKTVFIYSTNIYHRLWCLASPTQSPGPDSGNRQPCGTKCQRQKELYMGGGGISFCQGKEGSFPLRKCLAHFLVLEGKEENLPPATLTISWCFFCLYCASLFPLYHCCC